MKTDRNILDWVYTSDAILNLEGGMYMHISAIVHCSLSTSEIVLGCEGFHKEQMELSRLLSLAKSTESINCFVLAES